MWNQYVAMRDSIKPWLGYKAEIYEYEYQNSGMISNTTFVIMKNVFISWSDWSS